MTQQILTTSRLRLEPLSDDHLDYEIELDSDPEVMRFLGNGVARTAAEVRSLHKSRMAASETVDGLGFWSGFIGSEFVGWWILQPPERPDQGPIGGQAELGYRLMRRHWRQGLASEGARELLRYGFEDCGLDRIFAETMAVNAGSRATMSSIGMRLTREFTDESNRAIAGSEHGDVEYVITRNEWLARQR
jgi:RimJ/RimL family protein N-acetyltransferase